MKAHRIYHPYWNWECYKAGFYETSPPVGISKEEAKQAYADFLSKPILFYLSIEGVFNNWKNSCEHFLTNQNINRIAWLGQASMCFFSGISSEFKGGFYLLTEDQQKTANDIARNSLERWLSEHSQKS